MRVKRFIEKMPLYSKVLFCISTFGFIIYVSLSVLHKKNLYLFFGTFSSDDIVRYILSASAVLLAVGLISLLLRMFSNKKAIVVAVSVILMIPLLYFSGLIIAFDTGDTYYNFVSDDGNHEIVIDESSWLVSSSIRLYEKVSPYIIVRIGGCSTDDGYNPIANGKFEIEWHEENFTLSYYDGNRIRTEIIDYVEA